MENINEILQSMGIEIPEDKKDEVTKKIAENYKTVAEFNKKISKAESERDEFKTQLETAQNTLKGFEGIDPTQITEQLNGYKTAMEQAKADYDKKIAERDFNDVLRTELDKLKFSSTYAKKSVEQTIKSKGLTMENGKIIGLKDVLDSIKAEDSGVFIDEDNQPAVFTTHIKNSETGKKYSSAADIMKIKNTAERQKAIAENMDLFMKG